jgi:hypothetical protein
VSDMRQDNRVTSVTFTLPAGHKWTTVEAALREAHDQEYELRMAFFWECQRLEAEVERLTEFTTRTIIPNEELQAQVERLTKELENTDCMFAMASAFARDWNAAKEGKPSV